MVTDPKFKFLVEKEEENFGRFVLEPLEEGYGATLGNALRRVLLTSLAGAAITAVEIEGARHQFTTLQGLKEDIVELILNLKKARMKVFTDQPVKLTLDLSGPKKITAGDIEAPPEAEIVNKDLYLGSLADKKAKISAEFWAEKGFGYSMAEERKTGRLGVIPIDAVFSPVLRVNYKVEATRLGRMTNLDKLILEVWTDGTLTPQEAVKEAAKILVSYFLQVYEPKAVFEEGVMAVTPQVSEEILKMTLEELDLPTRIVNSLRKGGIETVGQLLGTPRKELEKIKNLGVKSLQIVEEKLREKGVAFTV